LQQAGWQNQTSQRNVDLVQRPPHGWNPAGVHIPFSIGNPFQFTSKLNVYGILIGLNQWMPKFFPDPPPDLAPGQVWEGELQLVPAVQQNGPSGAPVEPSISGDAVRVDVSVYLNDLPQNGFSVDFVVPVLKVYLPLIMK